MTEQLDVQQMAQRLLAADNILILCHKNPDGDTIGCGSALYEPTAVQGRVRAPHSDGGGSGRFAAVWRK